VDFMQTDIQEIYQTAILPLPEKEQLKLASLILEKVVKKDESINSEGNGETRAMFGMWEGKEFTYEEYLKLDHNERIDFDLAKAYADNHEDED